MDTVAVAVTVNQIAITTEDRIAAIRPHVRRREVIEARATAENIILTQSAKDSVATTVAFYVVITTDICTIYR